MDILYDWVRNIVFFMILNTIIMNLLGNSSYKKYAKIASGMILLLLVISPLLKILRLEENIAYHIQLNEYSAEASEFENNILTMENQQRDLIFQEYGDRIRTQVELILQGESLSIDQFTIYFERDIESEYFGEILEMNIVAISTKKATEIDSRIAIEKIEISKADLQGGQGMTTTNTSPSPEEINIKIKLSDFYNIGTDNINISIQGG